MSSHCWQGICPTRYGSLLREGSSCGPCHLLKPFVLCWLQAAEANVQGDEERPSASDGQGSVTHLSTVGVLQSGRPVYAEDEEAYG